MLACAVRLLDRGFFRIGGEDYAESNDSYGLATMRKEHVTLTEPDFIRFDYPAKSGKRREQSIVDPEVFEIVQTLKRRRGGGDELLAYKAGRRWIDVRSEDINGYIKAIAGDDFSAKAFRTWNATVLAAVALAVSGPAATGLEDGAQARRHARGEGGRALPRQHAGRVPRVLHRPARLRPLRLRAHDQRRPAASSARSRTWPRSTAQSRKRCSS